MRNKDAKVGTFPIWRKYKGASAIGKKRNGRNLRTELLFVLLLIFFYSFGALECSAQALAVRKTAVERKIPLCHLNLDWQLEQMPSIGCVFSPMLLWSLT